MLSLFALAAMVDAPAARAQLLPNALAARCDSVAARVRTRERSRVLELLPVCRAEVSAALVPLIERSHRQNGQQFWQSTYDLTYRVYDERTVDALESLVRDDAASGTARLYAMAGMLSATLTGSSLLISWAGSTPSVSPNFCVGGLTDSDAPLISDRVRAERLSRLRALVRSLIGRAGDETALGDAVSCLSGLLKHVK